MTTPRKRRKPCRPMLTVSRETREKVIAMILAMQADGEYPSGPAMQARLPMISLRWLVRIRDESAGRGLIAFSPQPPGGIPKGHYEDDAAEVERLIAEVRAEKAARGEFPARGETLPAIKQVRVWRKGMFAGEAPR
jgi:hypothetical protein